MEQESTNTEPKKDEGFAFGKLNYKLLIIGFAIIVFGFILMAGGASDDPNVFNYEMFNARRLYVAPILIILGFVTEIVAIMYKKGE